MCKCKLQNVAPLRKKHLSKAKHNATFVLENYSMISTMAIIHKLRAKGFVRGKNWYFNQRNIQKFQSKRWKRGADTSFKEIVRYLDISFGDKTALKCHLHFPLGVQTCCKARSLSNMEWIRCPSNGEHYIHIKFSTIPKIDEKNVAVTKKITSPWHAWLLASP